MAESQDLKHRLLETNEEYRDLVSTHHQLDDRLQQLEAKHYLSNDEQLEEVSLKKRKLHMKDRMAAIIQGFQSGSPHPTVLA